MLRLLAIAVLIAPFALLLLVSLHPPGAVPAASALWPKSPGFAAWLAVFDQVPMATGLFNSALIAAISAPVAVVTASLGGFGLSRVRRSVQYLGLLVLVLAASVPYASIWLPRFLLLNQWGLAGSWWPVLLPALMGGSPLLVLLYWFVIRQLSPGPIQAARLEGLSWLAIWWRVVLPQLPAINWAVAALAALWAWANWLDPILYIQSPSMQTATQMLDALVLMGESHWSLVMAASVLLCLPLLVFAFVALLWAMKPRRASMFVLVLPLVVMLSACGRDQQTTQLRLQAVADAVEAKAYRELIAAFEAENPDIAVEFWPVGRHAEHVTRLVTAYAGGNGPDLFLINFRRWGQFIKHDLLEPIGPLLSAEGSFRAEDYFAPSLEGFTVDDELICMPQNFSSLVVYYNRELFQRFEVPEPADDWSWREFHDAAVALTRDLDGDRKPDVFGLDVDPSVVRLAPFIWQAGGQLVDTLDRPTRFALRDRKSLIGLMFLKRLHKEKAVIPGLPERRASSVNARFLRGEVAMTLNSRRFTANLRARRNLDWDVAPLPQYKQAATVLHADAYCLAKSSDAKQAAARFVRFATSVAGQRHLARSGRIVPVNKVAAQSTEFLDPDLPPGRAQVFLDADKVMRRTPNIANWYEIETRVNPLIEEWMFERPPPGQVEELTGLRDAYRLVLMIEKSAGELLLP